MGIFPHCNGDYSPPIGGKFPTQIKMWGISYDDSNSIRSESILSKQAFPLSPI